MANSQGTSLSGRQKRQDCILKTNFKYLLL